MVKSLKLGTVLFAAIFVLSLSAAQACVVIPGKACGNEPCQDEECPLKEAKAMLLKVSCGSCANTTDPVNPEDVTLDIKGMTCGGCANRVKSAPAACEGVTDVHVSHTDGKATLHVEEGKADKAALIEAAKQLGFSASEG